MLIIKCALFEYVNWGNENKIVSRVHKVSPTRLSRHNLSHLSYCVSVSLYCLGLLDPSLHVFAMTYCYEISLALSYRLHI